MSNIPRSAEWIRQKRDEELDHLSRESEDIARERAADKERLKALADENADLRAKIDRLEKMIRFQRNTDPLWEAPPDTNPLNN